MRDLAFTTLSAAATGVLGTPEPLAKVRLGRAIAAMWRGGSIGDVGSASAPNRPARPARPALRLPRDLPKRKISRDSTGRIALLHALAHIELNAIDLAWDMIARFAGADLPRAFFDDWVGVAVEESGHFALLDQRLAALGAEYLPAHDGLWAAAEATAHDLLARLAVVPLVLEARGLDVTPAMISRLRAVDDAPSADILEIIYRDEIGHVAVGKRWFDHVVAIRGLQPVATWQDLVRRYFKGGVKPPFNIAAREAAGFSAAFYGPLGDEFLARKAS
ncbi:MAG: ferritin-like domain-containing protein [Proteobacteria bacterium]|nr:ferritin-like domain-containing protein [Pseudomonadota bacterium]